SIYEETTVTALTNSHGWKVETTTGESFVARTLVGADGRNSTVARLCNLLPRPERERIALQSHLPLPDNFGNSAVLQFLPKGYSGLAPVNDEELNVCLVAKPREIEELKAWATKRFGVSPNHAWRTITPLTREALSPAHGNLLFIGDAARVVEPFTGEGIYYALRSGELAAQAIIKIIQGEDRQSTLREFARFSCHFIKRDITDQAITAFGCRVLQPINTDIDNDRAVVHMFGLHEIRLAYCRDQNVSRARNLCEIPATRMHGGDRRVCVLVFLHKQKGERFADDHAAPKNDDVHAADLDLAFDEQALHTKRGAWNKPGRIAEREFCNVLRMKTVHIFARIE